MDANSSSASASDAPSSSPQPSPQRTSSPDSTNDQLNMADKLRAQQQLEHIKNRHLGTGSVDTTTHEWTSNIMRDTYASILSHHEQLSYGALALGMSNERFRIYCLERMLAPVGPRPREEPATSTAANETDDMELDSELGVDDGGMGTANGDKQDANKIPQTGEKKGTNMANGK